MNNVNGVNTSNTATTLNPMEMSQQDFIAAVYLERGEMLDGEVRRLIDEIDKSNQYVEAINTLVGKSNVAEYGTTMYTDTTWNTSGNNVILDNGYGLKFQPDGKGGTTFTIIDGEGNQLIYLNQTLIPVPAGTTVDALEAGIPVMSDMSFVLDDGTKINFQVGSASESFNSQTLEGGLADVRDVIITRGNQHLMINNVDTDQPTIQPAALDSEFGSTTTVAEVVDRPQTVVDGHLGLYHKKQWTEILPSSEYVDDVIIDFKNRIEILNEDEQASMYEKFLQDGVTIKWDMSAGRVRYWSVNGQETYESQVEDAEPLIQNYNYKPNPGEGMADFIERAANASAHAFRGYIDSLDDHYGNNVEGLPGVTYIYKFEVNRIQPSLIIPPYSYDITRIEVDYENGDGSPFDQSFNDGHILTESGGLHKWEYNGLGTGSMTQTNPNDANDQVTGYFARKLAFEQELDNELNVTYPILTQKEQDLLTDILKVPFSDASGIGHLTPEEWSALKDSIMNARDHLNSNSQIQTVQLQRAMQTYNQNYEAMSNAQQKIYSLLRDIISNMK